MEQIVCIPNLSEGRDKSKIAIFAELIRSKKVKLLDFSADIDHNRSVFTFIGEPNNVIDTAVCLSGKAIEQIRIDKHSGVHPRVGSIDVIPIVPYKNSNIDKCRKYINEIAQNLWRSYKLPSFFYGYGKNDTNLAKIRKTGVEKLDSKILDVGDTIHPTAGTVALVARLPLIAYNINLSTSKVGIAKKIAKSIRGSSGGFASVKAMGFYLESRNLAQVSINLTDYKRVPLKQVFDEVSRLAKFFEVEIYESELIGMAPKDAFFNGAKRYLKLRSLEKQLF